MLRIVSPILLCYTITPIVLFEELAVFRMFWYIIEQYYVCTIKYTQGKQKFVSCVVETGFQNNSTQL